MFSTFAPRFTTLISSKYTAWYIEHHLLLYWLIPLGFMWGLGEGGKVLSYVRGKGTKLGEVERY